MTTEEYLYEYKTIVAMLDDGMTAQQIATKLDLPVKQIMAIEADLYEIHLRNGHEH